jgi:hypothetical protein
MALAFLRPDQEDFNASIGGTGAWVDQAGSPTNIFASVDEATTDDVDYILSPAFTTNNSGGMSILRFRLTDPTINTTLVEPIRVRYRFRKTGTGDKALNVSLKQGTTVIASWSHTGAGITTSFQTVTQTLTTPQAFSITDFSDLFIEFMDDEV